MSALLRVGDLTFEVARSPRRRSVEITVDRDCSLKLKAPTNLADAELAKVVARQRAWVYKTLAEKKLLVRPYVPKEYVSGEGFYYLGRSYRLKLADDVDRLILRSGRFVLPRSAAAKGREIFVAWYTARAVECVAGVVERLAFQVGAKPKRVVVRDVGCRWASCGKNGTLYFHWRVVLLPKRAVEYVVLHELAHLKEPLHTAEFWRILARAMPDWAERKNWLAQNGSRFDL